MASSEGFLTHEQREMLKIASQNSEILSSSPKSPTSLLSDHQLKVPAGGKAPTAGIAVRHVRRSHSGKFVRVKKDGAGGKGTWGKLLDVDGESHIDRNDPNYDSGEEPYQLVGSTISISEGWLDGSFIKSSGEGGELQDNKEKVRRYKEEVVTIIHEYFLSDDIPELIHSLEDLGAHEFNSIFLKKLITLAMDRKNREKEMASILLSALHIEIFSTEDIVNGFVMLLESAEDTALDILDASNELALFLARAVIDDVLAPLNLEEIGSRLPPNCSGSETVHMARSLIAARHAGERILRCWGGGTGWAVEDAKDKIMKLLEEYESGGVVAEACQCIRDLGMPFFNHEVVKKALVMAMEKKNDQMLDLLQECFSEGLITINQMTKGFTRVKDGLDDLALDIPNAKEKFNFYMEYAQKKGWLLPSFGSSAAADALSISVPAS
ncbi:programmed cell death protein 4-like [Carica papaya]|uniref:programmed cell death protein 4-like n=1 Tax=Carica papaya TaxID=3649 RepID=UPI000B8C7900|nr:programmed cell death protein 4-like [Carica papaya]